MAPPRKRKADTTYVEDNKSILLPGGDSGIGYAVALNLALGNKEKRLKLVIPVPEVKEQEDLLQKLPGELRNKIYAFVLVDDEGIRLYRNKRYGTVKHWRRTKFHRPGIFLASKQMRQEAMSVYYQTNYFVISTNTVDLPSALAYFERISSLCRKIPFENFIVSISLRGWRALPTWWPIVQLIRNAASWTHGDWRELFECRGSYHLEP